MYTLDGMIIARENGHVMNFIATANCGHGLLVDKYLCQCGAEVQIANRSKVGIWVSDFGLKPCPKA